MSSLSKRWSRKADEPLGDRVRGTFLPQEPLKSKIEKLRRMIKGELKKLDGAEGRLRRRGSETMRKTVSAMERHDGQYASVHAAELAEMRKMAGITADAKMALEQISIRLESIEEVGDIATLLAPVVPVTKGLEGGLSGFFPEAGSNIGTICEMLNGLVSEAGSTTGLESSFKPSGEESEKIISEAMAVVERRGAEKMPSTTTEEQS